MGHEPTTLPVGTRVLTLRALPADEGGEVPPGSVARVERVDGPHHHARTASGRAFCATRDALAIQATDPAADVKVDVRLDADPELEAHVVLEAVVGSRAWGLAGPDSDEDRRGVFVQPFLRSARLQPPDEVYAPPGSERQLWEAAKALRQALRAEVLTTELLWSPEVVRCPPLGASLRALRDGWLTRQVHGSFSRYAIGQIERLRARGAMHRAEVRLLTCLLEHPDATENAALADLGPDAPTRLRQVLDSLRARGHLAVATLDALRGACRDAPAPWRELAHQGEPRPKGAYHVVRILHSGVRILRGDGPLVRVDDPALAARLLAIKAGQVPLSEVEAEARELAAAMDAARTHSPLPEAPDPAPAEAWLFEARAWAARRALGEPTA